MAGRWAQLSWQREWEGGGLPSELGSRNHVAQDARDTGSHGYGQRWQTGPGAEMEKTKHFSTRPPNSGKNLVRKESSRVEEAERNSHGVAAGNGAVSHGMWGLRNPFSSNWIRASNLRGVCFSGNFSCSSAQTSWTGNSMEPVSYYMSSRGRQPFSRNSPSENLDGISVFLAFPWG